MKNIIVSSVVVTTIETNCYIARAGNCAAVVDPGEYSPALESALKKAQIKKLDYILLTHGHFDHIDGAVELKNNFGGQIVISEAEEPFFGDPSLNLCDDFGSTAVHPERADIKVNDGDTLPFDDGEIKVISTPGHTVGSVCYIIGDCLFTGDTLFRRSCGRTDFKTGNPLQMYASLRKLAKLDGDLVVYPGHMEETTLESERRNNPYMKA